MVSRHRVLRPSHNGMINVLAYASIAALLRAQEHQGTAAHLLQGHPLTMSHLSVLEAVVRPEVHLARRTILVLSVARFAVDSRLPDQRNPRCFKHIQVNRAGFVGGPNS
ncbi:hypothetical protein GCM10009075_42930 [Sphingomonas trueperi]